MTSSCTGVLFFLLPKGIRKLSISLCAYLGNVSNNPFSSQIVPHSVLRLCDKAMLASVLINGSNMSFPHNIIYGVLANIRLQSAMGEVLGELMFSLGTLGAEGDGRGWWIWLFVLHLHLQLQLSDCRLTSSELPCKNRLCRKH